MYSVRWTCPKVLWLKAVYQGATFRNMGEHYQVFEAKELELLSWKCPPCGTTVTFSVLTEEKFGIPAACPTCRQQMDTLEGALRDYRVFHRAASEIGVRVHTKPLAQQ
jgi:predicted RNA-binding Zn-ribbon protein involved in translation (DUF1610 family)